MIIHIENLKFQTIIGILDFERVTPQDVIVNLSIEYEYQDDFIDYADVASMIKSTLQTSKFLLIEDALNTLSVRLEESFSRINSLDLKITKPSILPDCIVSVSNHYKFNS